MPTRFRVKRSTVSGITPTTSDIAAGELAINLPDRKIFTSNGTAVYELGSNLTNLSVSANLTIGSAGDIVLTPGAGISANGALGLSSQVLHSNGSSVYWAAANAGLSSVVSQRFTANGTANSFTVTGGYIPNAIEVYVSGVKQVQDVDVAISSGSTVNFITPPLNGQVVDVFGFQSTGSISGYLALTGGTLGGNLTFSNGSVLVSNGSFGTNGQVLTSNGTSMYWSSAGFTNGQSISVNNFVVTGAFTANGANGTAGQVLTTSGTGVYWSSAGVNTAAQYAWTNTHTFAANVTFDNSTLFINAALDRVGVGTTNPEFNLHTVGAAEWPVALRASLNTTTNRTHYLVQRSLGTVASPTAVTSGTNLGGLGIGAYDGTNWSLGWNGGAEVSAFASQNWTPAARGTHLAFLNTPDGTSSITERMRIAANGFVGIGTSAPDATLTVTGNANVSGNVVISGTATVSGNLTVTATSGLIVANGAGIQANGSLGTAGQVLTSNGSSAYWAAAAAGVNTAAQYTWTNTHNFTNVVTFSTSNAIILPVGNTASRPAASNGMIRYNTNTGLVEVVANTTWTGVMAAYSSVREQFTASNNQTTFTVTGGYVPGQIDVYYNGVKLRSGSEVNVSSGSTVILAAGAANNALIEVVGIGPTFVVSNTAQIVYQQFTASNNQTTFTVTNGYVPGQVDVFADGVKLVNGVDVNVSSGGSIVLSTGVPNNTIVEVKGYTTPLVSAQTSTAVRQTFTANATVNNNFTVTGGYIPGQVDVFYNGAKLVNGSDVNTSSGTTIVLTSNAAVGATVDVVGINYFAAGGGVTTPVRQQFVATANQVTFTVTGGYTPGQIDVFRNGVKLTPGADVNISGGSTAVLVSPAANGDNIDVVGFAATSYQDSVRKSGDTISGSLSISSNLAVTGAATFSNTIAVTGTSTLTGNVTTSGVFTDPTGTIRPIVQGTANTVSGTNVDYTGLPSWIRRITIAFNGVSTNGSSVPQVQLGTSSGFTTSGYLGAISAILSGNIPGCATISSGFSLADGGHAAAAVFHGTLTLCNVGGNNWTGIGILGRSDGVLRTYHVAGSIALSGTLDRIRLTTVNGTDVFDAGTINILYE